MHTHFSIKKISLESKCKNKRLIQFAMVTKLRFVSKLIGIFNF